MGDGGLSLDCALSEALGDAIARFLHLSGREHRHARQEHLVHARNDGRVTLSPAYDIAMHRHHDRDNRKSALDVNGGKVRVPGSGGV